MRQRLLCILVLTLAAVSSPQDQAEPPRHTLRSAVAAALEGNPAAIAARRDVDASRLNVSRAVAQGYLPRLELSLNSGLVPEARGDIFSSPDKQTDLDGLGIFYRLDLDLVQPLLTFGRAGAAVNAARRTVGVEESRRDSFLEGLAFEVMRACWGVSSSLQTEDLARQAGESYDELLAEIRERLDREDSEVDDEDLLEAKSHALEIEVIRQESIEKKILAVRTFNTLLGLDPETPVLLADEPQPAFIPGEEILAAMIRLAEDLRPELRGLEAARQAMSARITLQKRQMLPVIFLAASFGYAHAGNRDDQTNPFAVDNFNYRNIGTYVGLRWEPDLFLRRAEIRQAEAEYDAIEERLNSLRDVTRLEVSRIHGEVRRNDALLKAAKDSLQAARSWVLLSRENWELGLGDAFRLLRAYQQYFALRTAEIQREYEFKVSLAELARIIGDTELYLKWAAAGRVALD